MGLIGDRLAAWAARRPHLLLAAVPGATDVRLAVEAQAHRYGWPLAASPADADLLVVAGEPGPELAEAIERVWAQLPGPRARARTGDRQGAAGILAAMARRLTGADGEAVDLGPDGGMAPAHQGGTGGHDGDDHQGGDDQRGGHDQRGGPGGHGRQGGHDQQGGRGGDEGQGHGGMSMPGGLMMADRADDRDGLKLDVLHLALGPVLADWPAGLVVELTVQGDVVQAATGRVLPPAAPVEEAFWDADVPGERRRRHAASHLDSLGRLWAVAGWPSGAATARRLRDELIDGGPVDEAYREFERLDRRARRSRALRWSTDGLGVLSAPDAARADVTGPAARAADTGGDATARWRCWLAETGRLLAGGEPTATGPRGAGGASAALLAVATRLMVGLDLAAARLVLASFDPDPDELAAVGVRR
ncbi:hypothetical protein [Micromonospora siamensis]|uniref:Uncharacterized protein n=1 Tax=Micromonospora siamensis TaxID=299152 RepID=A0A1C5I6M5_9ACTN|nr:hypothetical protein [Micromonospora siamensis]SCG53950.1 hypothetical protein GA0074704_3002 [Micromonospora siamensis]